METVFTVEERDLKTSQSWTNDYETKEEALEEAYSLWGHLTKNERKNRLVEVYEDVILSEDTEDTDEDRRSWNDGYAPLLALQYVDKYELADKVWKVFSDYVPVWDREDDTETIIREDPELALCEFIDSVETDLADDPENEYIQETLANAKDLWRMSR